MALVCGFIAQPTPAGESNSTPGEAVQKKSATGCLLWKVKSDTSTVYLLGSVHVAKKEMYPLHPAIEKAFSDSSAVVVEADVKPEDQAKLMGLIQKRATYTPPDNIEKHVTAETIAALKKHFGSKL